MNSPTETIPPRTRSGDNISVASSPKSLASSAPITRSPTHIGNYGPLPAITFVAAPTTRRRSQTSSRDGGETPGASLKNQCSYSDDHKMMGYSDIWKPPIVRQWLLNGRLYREAEERTPSRFELFFDLLLVGVIHQLAETAAENVSAASVAKVVLTFYPAWSIWVEYGRSIFTTSLLHVEHFFNSLRNWLNTSGVDDVAQRAQTLLIMLTLIGYSANASAIEIGRKEIGEGEPIQQSALLARNFSSHSTQRALVAAAIFCVIAKACRVITCLQYAYALPCFREAHLVRALGTLIVALVLFGLIWASSLKVAAILTILAIAAEVGGRILIGLGISWERRHARMIRKHCEEHGEDARLPVGDFIQRRMCGKAIPAINIEHLIERNGALVTIVLGESVISTLYVATRGSLGASQTFGRASLGLIITFVYNAVYFDSALSRRYTHASRRHWFSHQLWDLLNWPLCTALILASAAMSKMVPDDATPSGVRWQFGVGLGKSINDKGKVHHGD
ncbi:hypothetical protein P7C70_g1511, partial [Phenoliferia sp. Uapishka_3]